MRKAEILDCVDAVIVSIGLSGMVATVLGLGGVILGVSGNTVNKLAQVLQPHQPTIEKMVFHGANMAVGGIGIAVTAGAVGTRLLRLLDHTEQEAENSVNTQCKNCVYYSDSTYLPCAVNPHQPKDCQDFTSN